MAEAHPEAVTPPPASAIPSPLLIVGATIAGFAGGTFLSGLWLTASGAILVAVWSVLVGILVVAPLAARMAKERFLLALSDPSEMEETLLLAAVDGFASRAADLMEAEGEVGDNMRRTFANASELFLKSLEGSERGIMSGVAKRAQRMAMENASDEDIQDMARDTLVETAVARIAPEHQDKAPIVSRWLSALSRRNRGEGRRDEGGGSFW